MKKAHLMIAGMFALAAVLLLGAQMCTQWWIGQGPTGGSL